MGCAVSQKDIPEDATLVLNLGSDGDFSTKTIQPDLDMRIYDYIISGKSSVGSFTLPPVRVGDPVPPVTLKPGAWTITVNARNDDPTPVVIGSGSTAVNVYPKKITEAKITVTPLVGKGTLQVNLTWPSGVLLSPAVTHTLVKNGSTTQVPQPPSFVVSGDAAAYDSGKTLDNGYYRFSVSLYNGPVSDPASKKVYGKVDIARIITDQVAGVDYVIEQLNGSDVDIEITPEMNNPLTVELSGGQPYLLEGQSMTITGAVTDENGATFDPAEIDSYEWYIQGDLVKTVDGTGTNPNIFNIPADLPDDYKQPGSYWLDLIVVEGTILSSQTLVFEIVENTQKILFVSDRDGDNEIWAMTGTGNGLDQLTNNIGFTDMDPAWSPNFEKIAYVSNVSGSFELWTMNADGSGKVQLALLDGIEASPAWSPDGKKIAFVSNSSGLNEIWTVNADGTGSAVKLTTSTEGALDPAWSPDGTQIAYTFVDTQTFGNAVHVMRADGTGDVALTTNAGYFEGDPAWSPDGTKIAFVSNQTGNNDVWTIVVDTDSVTAGLQPGTQSPLTNGTTANETSPVWSPDGASIAFVSDRTGNSEVFVMDAAGNNETNLTNNAAGDIHPEW
jgi:Tol biopolymer transport system component